VHKAFGVDTRVFHPLPSPDCEGKGASEGGLGKWDVLFVGMFVAYKRPWLLAHKTGSRLAVGRLDLAPDMLVGVCKRVLVVGHLSSAFVCEVDVPSLLCLTLRSHPCASQEHRVSPSARCGWEGEGMGELGWSNLLHIWAV
jgi:hypothetical protein